MSRRNRGGKPPVSQAPPQRQEQPKSILQRIASDPDVVVPAREAKKQSIKIGCGGVVFCVAFAVSFGIAILIHEAVVLTKIWHWQMPPWIDWVDSQGLGIFFVISLFVSLAVWWTAGRKLIKNEREGEEEHSGTVTEEGASDHEQH